ncbi:MAG: CDP-alcohol phosphatidyltransferase family protein [Acidobacteriota bacterium]
MVPNREKSAAVKKQYPLNLANILTLLRIALIPLFIHFLLTGQTGKALTVFIVASITDVLDGTAARIFGQRTSLGTYLDPAADKLLMTTSYILLSIPSISSPNVIPLWLTIVVIGRDILIALSALVVTAVSGPRIFRPSVVGKITTVCQVTVIFCLLASNYFGVSPEALQWLYYITLGLTIFSGMDYALKNVRSIVPSK